MFDGGIKLKRGQPGIIYSSQSLEIKKSPCRAQPIALVKG
jgi:hypothetical protein